ncbi:MAG: hypothetical protein ACO331_08265, partial [Prochlorothrix sp.]
VVTPVLWHPHGPIAPKEGGHGGTAPTVIAIFCAEFCTKTGRARGHRPYRNGYIVIVRRSRDTPVF